MSGTLLFNPALRHLDRHYGEPIRWFRSMGDCPCRDPESNVWNRSHSLCNGTGKLRKEVDLTGSNYVAIITSANSARVIDQIGPVEQGSLLCSSYPLPNGDNLAKDDWLIRINQPGRTETEVIERGSGSSDVFIHWLVTEILAVYDESGEVTSGWELDTATNAIVWTGGPTTGSRYSIRFRYQPYWQVMLDPITMRPNDPDGSPLPQAVLLQLVRPREDGT